jgi:hypothetical protein
MPQRVTSKLRKLAPRFSTVCRTSSSVIFAVESEFEEEEVEEEVEEEEEDEDEEDDPSHKFTSTHS